MSAELPGRQNTLTMVWMISTLERVTDGLLVRKLVCFHPIPSSCSWIQTTPRILTGAPELEIQSRLWSTVGLHT
jgi:hypothetical protein